jgi:hypothetical protein
MPSVALAPASTLLCASSRRLPASSRRRISGFSAATGEPEGAMRSFGEQLRVAVLLSTLILGIGWFVAGSRGTLELLLR